MSMSKRLEKLEQERDEEDTPFLIMTPSMEEYMRTHPEPRKGWGTVRFLVMSQKCIDAT